MRLEINHSSYLWVNDEDQHSSFSVSFQYSCNFPWLAKHTAANLWKTGTCTVVLDTTICKLAFSKSLTFNWFIHVSNFKFGETRPINCGWQSSLFHGCSLHLNVSLASGSRERDDFRSFNSATLRPWQNEDTLWRQHCVLRCCPSVAKRGNIVVRRADKKFFWRFSETFFVSKTQNLCQTRMLRAWQNEDTFGKHDYVSSVAATMCPSFCLPLSWWGETAECRGQFWPYWSPWLWEEPASPKNVEGTCKAIIVDEARVHGKQAHQQDDVAPIKHGLKHLQRNGQSETWFKCCTCHISKFHDAKCNLWQSQMRDVMVFQVARGFRYHGALLVAKQYLQHCLLACYATLPHLPK